MMITDTTEQAITDYLGKNGRCSLNDIWRSCFQGTLTEDETKNILDELVAQGMLAKFQPNFYQM